MTSKNKQRLIEAFENAAEMIRGHVECGLTPEDVNELDEEGLIEYSKACEKVARFLHYQANKYRK